MMPKFFGYGTLENVHQPPEDVHATVETSVVVFSDQIRLQHQRYNANVLQHIVYWLRGSSI